MSLFQRIKSPFTDIEDDYPAPSHSRSHPVGDLLRDRREELGLNLDEIGEALRIRPIYLAALEQGRAQDLPGPTYAIGFIRAYADYLGFDIERILERYKAESAEVHARPDLALPVPLGARSLPGGPILLVGLILALCGYGTWYYLSTGERSRPERVAAIPAELRPPLRPGGAVSSPAAAEPSPSADGAAASLGLVSPSDAVAPAGSAAAGPAGPRLPAAASVASPAAAALPSPPAPPAASQGTAAAPAPASSGTAPAAAAPPGDAGGAAGTRIDIRALADCWIQVRAGDQAVVFSRVLKAGETYHVPRPGLFLRTGNAGALALAVDGKPAPAIGGIGTLRRNVALDPEALLAGTAIRG